MLSYVIKSASFLQGKNSRMIEEAMRSSFESKESFYIQELEKAKESHQMYKRMYMKVRSQVLKRSGSKWNSLGTSERIGISKDVATRVPELASVESEISRIKVILDSLPREDEEIRDRAERFRAFLSDNLERIRAQPSLDRFMLQLYSMFLKGKGGVGKRYMNIAIMGPAGSGKTSSAEIISRFFELSGILAGGLPFKVDNPGTLISKYVSGTTGKTMQAFSDTIESVLFIDEAYGIMQGGNKGYGSEAVLAAMTQMDKYMGRHVLMFAGYQKDIESLLTDVNEGLSRRFPYKIYLKPMENDSLFQTFSDMVAKKVSPSKLLTERLEQMRGFFAVKEHFPNSMGDVMVLSGFFLDAWFTEEVLKSYNIETQPEEFVPKLLTSYKTNYLKG